MEPAQPAAGGDAIAAVFGSPDQELRTLHVPDAVGDAFAACFLTLRGVEDFAPNAPARADAHAQLLRFVNAGALALLVLLRRHAPLLLHQLFAVEAALKGHGGKHPPHVRLRNLRVGTLSPGAPLPSSDDPAVDPAAYAPARVGPATSELLLLAINALLGFAPLVVPGEKGGLPVHHHVPIAAHARSGTSVSFARPIAVHTEDCHAPRLYGHFALFAKMGNASAATPLWTVRSFLARIPEQDRRWVVLAMALPFLMRPGAGRLDAAAERLAAPLLARQWDGRSVLRYNGADYASLRDGSRILRVDALPRQWYRHEQQHALAVRALPLLRALFADVDDVARSAQSGGDESDDELASLSLRSGDVLLVSNKAGPHCRTAFDGPRYVQRAYADYSAARLWDGSLNFRSADERLAHLSGCVARDFEPDQVAHLERHLGVPLLAAAASATAAARGAAAADAVAEIACALAAALAAAEAAIDDVAHMLMEEAGGAGSPAAATGATRLRELLNPLRRLHGRLGALRRGGGGATWQLLLLPHAAALLPPLRACRDALRPLAFRLRDDNLQEELARVRRAAAAPGAVDAVLDAVTAAAAALDACSAAAAGAESARW